MYYVYEDYIKENNLENNTIFLKYELVPMLLRAIGIHPTNPWHQLRSNDVTAFYTYITGIDDRMGVLTDTLTDKYLGYAQEADKLDDLHFMMPGLIDVNILN